MKKILTLVIAVTAFMSVHAQTSKEEARRIILGDGNGGSKNYPSGGDRDVILGGGSDNRNSYPNSYPSGDRQYQIDQINREYDNKIQSIRNNQYLSNEEKQRSIRQLENDRKRRIQQINSTYNNGDYKNNDDCNNKGKHKGWNKKSKNKNWKKGKRERDDD